jgi:hypothetical protein
MQARNKWISDGLTSPPRWAAAAGGEGKAASRKNRGGAQGQMTGRGLADLERKHKHLTAKNKLFIHDPSDLRIMHMNSKMLMIRRDLRIHGLRSTIGATVQKVKFPVNSGASFYFFCVTTDVTMSVTSVGANSVVHLMSEFPSLLWG